MKYLDLTGLGEVWANIKSYISSKVPTKTSQLQNDSNYATTSQLPSKTSQLTNDSDFTTNAKLATKQDTISDLASIRSGASKGATAVQPSALNNYLPLTGGAIIGNIENRSTDDGWKPGFEWLYNGERFAYIHAFTNETAGEKSLHVQADTNVYLLSRNLSFIVSNDDGSQNALNFQGKSDGTFNFYSNTPANLGTSTNKWKTLNGINPGALSLPDPSPAVSIVKALPASGGTITADVDSWFEIRTRATSPNALIQLFVAGGNATYAKNTGDTLVISVPMREGVSVTIFYRDIETPIACRLIPCLGNI